MADSSIPGREVRIGHLSASAAARALAAGGGAVALAVALTVAAGSGTGALASLRVRLAPVSPAPALPAGARVLGPAAASARLRVTIALRSADPGGLTRLARQVSTPGSGTYRHFLRPGQVQVRFGAPAAAISA